MSSQNLIYDEELVCDVCHSKGAYELAHGNALCPNCTESSRYSCDLDCDGCALCED